MNQTFLNIIATGINRYLQLDPRSNQRLAALNNKVITIDLLPLHFTFQLAIHERNAKLHTGAALEADATITGTPLQMLGVMLNKHQRHTFFADDVKLEGSAECGQQVIALFDELQIDWEEHLSQWVGDVPSYHVGRTINQLKHWLGKANESMSANISEYLHEEIAWFPTRELLDHFYADIDDLRMQTDRLEAKYHQLQQLYDEQEPRP